MWKVWPEGFTLKGALKAKPSALVEMRIFIARALKDHVVADGSNEGRHALKKTPERLDVKTATVRSAALKNARRFSSWALCGCTSSGNFLSRGGTR